MKKRFILFTACAVLTFGMGALALTACGEDEGKSGVPEHEHVWGDTFTTTKRATCSEEGQRVYYCTVPGCTAEKPEKIDKAPHTWGSEFKSTATCESDGVIIWTCTVCGAEEEGNPVPALGHDDVVQSVSRNATCLLAGETIVKCSRCERETTAEIPKLEHDYRLDQEKSKEPTCKEPGEEVYKCVNGCEDVKTETIEKLDHTIEYDEYELPTFEKAGIRKGHCTVCGDPIDEVLPKLVDGENIEFSFKLMKGKRVFTLSTTTFKVVNEKGDTVATGTMKDVVGGRYKVTLPIHEDTRYTLKVENIKGYTAEEVTLTPAEPSGEVQFSAKMYEIGDQEAPQNFYNGSMMQDFNFKDIDGKEIHLKDVLKKNKVVMLDFFYGQCPACNSEAPYLQILYDRYKSQGFEIIGISSDYWEYGVDTYIKQFRTNYNITFPLIRQPASDTDPYLYNRFGVRAFPTAVFLDHEGFVKSSVTGAFPDEKFLEERILGYLDTVWEDMEDANNQTISVKPEKNADGLMLSVLRGDYLLENEENL